VNVFFSSGYVAAACDFDTTRKSGWIAESLTRHAIPGANLVPPEPLTLPTLERAHSTEYIAAVRSGQPAALAESNGLSWDPGVWTAACASNGGVVAAVTEALRCGRNAGTLASGLHHARRASGAGFCTFNGLALGARAALDAGARRVLIIDLDAHCGGGTVSIVREWEGIEQIDVSISSFDSYHEPGSRFALHIVRSADDYLPTIQASLRRLVNAPVDLVIYNAGMDPHQASLGGLRGVTFQMLAERERLLFDWSRERRVPVAFTMAGGYVSRELSRDDLVGLHRLTLASAAMANLDEPLELHRVMNVAYAGPHRGSEGFAFDANGRKTDAGFHAELLGDEDEDPFAYDLEKYLELTPANQDRFHRERYDYDRSEDFLEMLLNEQRGMPS